MASQLLVVDGILSESNLALSIKIPSSVISSANVCVNLDSVLIAIING